LTLLNKDRRKLGYPGVDM